MLTVTCILALAAFIAALVSLTGKISVNVAVLLLTILELLRCLPLK